jgi:hypothetical protein
MNTRLANRRYRFGRRLFTGAVTCLRWWLIAGIVLVPALSAVFAEVFELGLWSVTAAVLQWFAAGTAGLMLFANLPVWISRGCTRREITVAYAVFGALATVGLSAYLMAGFAAEHALLALAAEPPTGLGEALGSGARYLAITPIYFFAGTLIAALATRFSGDNRFTAAVLFGAGALYAAVLYLEFNDAWFEPSGSTAVWTATALALTAVLIAATAATLRSVPIRAKA